MGANRDGWPTASRKSSGTGRMALSTFPACRRRPRRWGDSLAPDRICQVAAAEVRAMSGSLLHRSPLRERTRGRWRGILAAHGIDPRYLTGKNGPCPMCGGKDRWRFTDFNSDGYWICNQCGHGTGTDLLLRCTGLPFKEVARRIEAVRGRSSRGHAEAQRATDAGQSQRHVAPCTAGRRGRHHRPVDAIPRHRTPHIPGLPADRSRRALLRWRHLHRAPGHAGDGDGPDGKPATIHRTYLTSDGHKAAVPEPRKLYSAVPKGSAVRLAR